VTRRALQLTCTIGLVLLGLSRPCRAQEIIMTDTPEPILDSVRQSYKGALIMLRDTLAGVQAQVQIFRRDLSQAGPETVVSRATRLRNRCVTAMETLQGAEPVFRSARAPNERVRAQSRELVSQMRTLRRALGEHCERTMTAEGPGVWADTLRAWGPYRTARIEHGLAAYYEAAGYFARAADFKVEPRLP
jgi:hypothetical protein